MTDKTITRRSAKFRAATREAGGRQLSVTISAAAAQALDAIRRRDGVTVRAAVERALQENYILPSNGSGGGLRSAGRQRGRAGQGGAAMIPADFADLLSSLAVSGARSREALTSIGDSGPDEALLVIIGENGACYLQCEQTDPATCAAVLSVALEALVEQRLKEPNPHPSMVALHAALVGAQTSDDETRN